MEDCLNPRVLYDSVVNAIEVFGSDSQKDALNSFEFNESMNVSIIKGENSIFKPISLEGLSKKEEIYGFVDDHRNKYLIAENYIKEEKSRSTLEKPKLFELILKYFEPNKIEQLREAVM